MASAGRKRTLVLDAKAHLAKGKDHESTSWFKWTPDWTLASMEYEKAATSFKQAQDYSNALIAFRLQANAQKEAGIPFSAGQSLEKASGVAKDAGVGNDVGANLLIQASDLFALDGKVQKSVDCLTKAAKLLLADKERSTDILSTALDILYDDEDLLRFGQDTFKLGITIYSYHLMYPELIDYLKKLIEIYFTFKQKNNIHKTNLSLIVVYLASDDFIGADDAYKNSVGSSQSMGFGTSDDAKVCVQMLHAFETGGFEALQKVFAMQIFTFLHPSIGRMANNIIKDIKYEKLESFGLSGSSSLNYSSSGFEVTPFPLDPVAAKADIMKAFGEVPLKAEGGEEKKKWGEELREDKGEEEATPPKEENAEEELLGKEESKSSPLIKGGEGEGEQAPKEQEEGDDLKNEGEKEEEKEEEVVSSDGELPDDDDDAPQQEGGVDLPEEDPKEDASQQAALPQEDLDEIL